MKAVARRKSVGQREYDANTICLLTENEEEWRWEWTKGSDEPIIALDAAEQDPQRARHVAREALLRGRRSRVLPPDAWGGCKDVNQAWSTSNLHLRGLLRTTMGWSANEEHLQ